MMYRQQKLFFSTLAVLATASFVSADEKGDSADVMLPVEISMDNVTEFDDWLDDYFSSNATNITEDMEDMEIDCTCDVAGISCTDPSDEIACVCEDGDVVCEDLPVEDLPVEAPSTVDEPLPPDTEIVEESGSYTVGSMVSLVISAAGVVAFAV